MTHRVGPDAATRGREEGMMEDDPMSLIDAEMSRLKAEARISERKLAEIRVPARRLAEFFISKTTNLVMMRCDFCESEWVRESRQEHDTDCPVGAVLGMIPR